MQGDFLVLGWGTGRRVGVGVTQPGVAEGTGRLLKEHLEPELSPPAQFCALRVKAKLSAVKPRKN